MIGGLLALIGAYSIYFLKVMSSVSKFYIYNNPPLQYETNPTQRDSPKLTYRNLNSDSPNPVGLAGSSVTIVQLSLKPSRQLGGLAQVSCKR